MRSEVCSDDAMRTLDIRRAVIVSLEMSQPSQRRDAQIIIDYMYIMNSKTKIKIQDTYTVSESAKQSFDFAVWCCALPPPFLNV